MSFELCPLKFVLCMSVELCNAYVVDLSYVICHEFETVYLRVSKKFVLIWDLSWI